jgi:peroxin-3
MLPDSNLEEIEFIRGAGFGGDYPNYSATISLSKLLNETRDFIDSPDFQKVLQSCLDEQFDVFDKEVFFNALMPEALGVDQGIEALRIQEGKTSTLANLLPSISRQAHHVVSGNTYLDVMTLIYIYIDMSKKKTNFIFI